MEKLLSKFQRGFRSGSKCMALCLAALMAFSLPAVSYASAMESAQAQQRKHVVKGRVLDTYGEPVAGAAVIVEGTDIGVTTEVDGTFSISASDNETLLFTCLGMKDVREKVDGKSVIDVVMEADGEMLEEVVAIGYSSIKKRDLTGSVASVGSDAIAKTVATSVDQVLQGRAAGLQMTQNSGVPGGGTSIRIRGVNSLNSSNEPIIVIDGVVIDAQTGSNTDNALSSINPNDIETMDVLKDASATAIYGAQGANGVILITTKRGRAGQTNVQFDANVGIQTMPRFLEVMDLPMYASHYNSFASLRGANQRDEYADPSKLTKGTDWQRELFKTAIMHNYNLSVNGGNEKATYAISGGYLNQDGIAYGSGFERYNLRANIDVNARKWLKLGISTAVSHSNQNINAVAGSNEGLIQIALKQSPAVAALNLEGGYDGPEDDNFTQSNPLGLANLLTNKNSKSGIRSNIYLDFSIIKGLNFKTEFSNDINVTNSYQFTPTYKFGSIYNSENSRQEQKNYSLYWAWRNVLTYNNTFGKHTVNAMLGQEMTSSHWEYIMAKRLNGPDNLHDMSAGDATTATNNGGSGNTKFSSFFGRVFYSFDERYLVTATLRADGSSNFAKGHRWGIFPSAAVAWRISEEPFLRDNRVLNDLKLRFGYGSVGNSNVPANAWQATLSSVTTNWGGGYLTGRIPNEYLSWETTNSYNVGLDLGLWNDRLNLVVDAYLKKTNDLLMEAVLPAYVGTAGQGSAGAPYGNMGSITNKGIEFTLNTVNVNRKNFSWTSNLVFSLNRNKVDALNTKDGVIDKTYQLSGNSIVVTRTQVGSSIGEFYGYNVIGRINDANDLYDKEGNLKVALPKGLGVNRDTGVWVGDWLYEDVTPDGVIDEKDRKSLGSPLPVFTGGFGNTFTWKGFDLNIYLTYSYGNKALNWLRVTMDNPNTTSNKFARANDFAKIGLIDENGSDTDIYNVYVTSANKMMPRMSAGDVNDNDRISSLYIEDASYIRLQNLSLSYRLPAKALEKMHLAMFRLTFNVQNLFTLTKYSGYDPEIGMTGDQYSNSGQNALLNGMDTGRYPSPRIYSFGLSIGF